MSKVYYIAIQPPNHGQVPITGEYTNKFDAMRKRKELQDKFHDGTKVFVNEKPQNQ